VDLSPDIPQLAAFFRALSDVSRLKIAGLLAEGPLSVEQLAAMLGLRPSTISHHLGRLAKAGLVSARAEGYYSVYSFDASALEAMARKLLAPETLPTAAALADRSGYDRKVLGDFLYPNGRLKSIPAQHKKLLVVLRHLAASFEPDKRYWERQVNEILGRFHADTATLRRELVGAGFLERETGQYWRTEGEGEASRGA
jgi:DNA-binding CsgD family transcriptional regulator